MLVKQLVDSVYRRRIYFFLGNHGEIKKHLTETWGKGVVKELAPSAQGQAFYFNVPSAFEGVKSRVYYLWSIRFSGSPSDIGTLAHESFHIASMILEDLGVDTLDKDGSESTAYYMESIFTQCMEFALEANHV